MGESIDVENRKQTHQKPPLSRRRIAGEILAGLAVAVPVLFVPGYVLLRAIPGEPGEHAIGTAALIIVFVSLAFPMLYGPASAIGVYVVGSRGEQTGSFLLTLVGGFLGGFVMLITLFGTMVLSGMVLDIIGVKELNVGPESTSERVVRWACGALVFLTAPIIATIGFNRTRRYKEPPSS